jgi:hypothetical protein
MELKGPAEAYKIANENLERYKKLDLKIIKPIETFVQNFKGELLKS